MLPETQDAPASPGKRNINVAISPHVRPDLHPPPRGIGLRPRPVTRTPVPEAAIDEDSNALTREQKVGTAPSAADGAVYEEPKSKAMHCASHREFTWRVSLRRRLHPATNDRRRGLRPLRRRLLPPVAHQLREGPPRLRPNGTLQSCDASIDGTQRRGTRETLRPDGDVRLRQ